MGSVPWVKAERYGKVDLHLQVPNCDTRTPSRVSPYPILKGVTDRPKAKLHDATSSAAVMDSFMTRLLGQRVELSSRQLGCTKPTQNGYFQQQGNTSKGSAVSSKFWLIESPLLIWPDAHCNPMKWLHDWVMRERNQFTVPICIRSERK